jgi:hypothetical protein
MSGLIRGNNETGDLNRKRKRPPSDIEVVEALLEVLAD